VPPAPYFRAYAFYSSSTPEVLYETRTHRILKTEMDNFHLAEIFLFRYNWRLEKPVHRFSIWIDG